MQREMECSIQREAESYSVQGARTEKGYTEHNEKACIKERMLDILLDLHAVFHYSPYFPCLKHTQTLHNTPETSVYFLQHNHGQH